VSNDPRNDTKFHQESLVFAWCDLVDRFTRP
jgi:hypothetical protein